MTPEEWFSAIAPDPLLLSIRDNPLRWIVDDREKSWRFRMPSGIVARRSRLFACSTTRQVWELLTTDARSAVLTSERYAYGRATTTDLLARTVSLRNRGITSNQIALESAQAASGLNNDEQQDFPDSEEHRPLEAARSAARAIATRDVGPAPPGRPTTPEWHAAWTAAFNAARALQADYLRDIFPPPGYTPNRDQAWITSTAIALSRQMDETGDFSTVPILADALQDAGCEDQTILNCCRMPSHTHVRGNWVVDLILDRL